jgi:hypothetical protein
MSSSRTIFSARIISWIWYRTVSKFSNRKVSVSPACTRRTSLAAIAAARSAARRSV